MTKTDTLFPFLNNIKTKLILINVVRKIPKTCDVRGCCHTLYNCKGKQQKHWKSRGGTCPIAGFANGSTLRATAIYSEVGNVTDVIA